MCLILAKPFRDLRSFSYLLLILALRESYRERQTDREVFRMKDCGSHGRSVFLPRTGCQGPETCPESSTPTVLFGVIFVFILQSNDGKAQKDGIKAIPLWDCFVQQ